MNTTRTYGKAQRKNAEIVRVETPVDLGAELRQLAAAMPGLRVTTLAVMAIRAGLPTVRSQLSESAAQLAAADDE